MTTFDRMLWRAAGRLQRALEPPVTDFQLPHLNYRLGMMLPQLTESLSTALRKGWSVSADYARQQILTELECLQSKIQVALHAVKSAAERISLPTQRDLYDEFMALHGEFEMCCVNLREQTVSVETEPIVLDDVELGRFRIQLDWRQILNVKADPYTVAALSPRYPASSRQITHPHVAGTRLCEGDATMPIQRALKSGRLTDFFHIVNRVLHTYNADGPYAALEEWKAVACHACNEFVSGELEICGHCQQSICDGCWNSCAHCTESCCDACISSCACCSESCCANCLTDCSECEEQVCPNCFPSDTLCKACHAHSKSPIAETTTPAKTQQSPSEIAVQSAGLGEVVVPA